MNTRVDLKYFANDCGLIYNARLWICEIAIYYSTSSKTKERIQKLNEKGDSKYIYLNELDRAQFQHNMTYGYYRYLPRKTVSD